MQFGCRTLVGSAVLLTLAGGQVAASDESATSVVDAFEKAEFHLGLRYRFETVDEDASPEKAEASTLRSTLSLETAPYRNVSFFIEAESVAVAGDDESFRNAGAGARSNDVTGRPVVADVAQTELNQVFVEFTPASFVLRAGRQEINLADQRFIGAVGWRQNHQSFDALSMAGVATEKISWGYTYLDEVHRIFGDSRGLNGHLVTAVFELGSSAARVYALDLDYEAPIFARSSTRTFGAEFTGKWNATTQTKVLYELEAATQSDTGDNPAAVEAGYAHLALGLARGPATVRVGWEQLEGSSEDGQFSTPLATLHKFNGWADKFLSTPEAGLEDLYVQVSAHRDAAHGTWRGSAAYHEFEAESASVDYGSELDVSVSWTSRWGQQFAVKAADYRADGFSTDTTKWMVWSAYTF